MQIFIFWTALFAVISFWIVGYVYIKTQDEIKQHESELSLLQTRLEHRKKGLREQESNLQEEIKRLSEQIQQQEQN